MNKELQQELKQASAKTLQAIKEQEFTLPDNYFTNKKLRLHNIAKTEAIGNDYFDQKKASLKTIPTKKITIAKQATIHKNWLLVAAAFIILLIAIPITNQVLNNQTTELSILESVDESFTTTELALLEGDTETFLYDSFYGTEQPTENEPTDYITELEDLFSIEQL